MIKVTLRCLADNLPIRGVVMSCLQNIIDMHIFNNHECVFVLGRCGIMRPNSCFSPALGAKFLSSSYDFGTEYSQSTF